MIRGIRSFEILIKETNQLREEIQEEIKDTCEFFAGRAIKLEKPIEDKIQEIELLLKKPENQNSSALLAKRTAYDIARFELTLAIAKIE